MQIKFYMPPEARGRDPKNCTPNLKFLTTKEKQAVKILGQVGDDKLLATIYLYDADNDHRGKWAEVEIGTYSTHGIQYDILHRRGLFKKNHNIRTQEEWVRLLRQYKKTLTEAMRQSNFLQDGGETFAGELIGICSMPKEQQQHVAKILEEFVSKVIIARAKFEALISI